MEVAINEMTGKKPVDYRDPFPQYNNAGILGALGLQGLVLANQLLSPNDKYTRQMLDVARNAGKYMPISTDPKQVYVHPHVQDIERAQIAGDNLLMGAARGISNNAGLNRGVANAGLIGLYNNGITQQGVNQLQALNNNAQNERQDAQVIYGQESDNAARALSAAQANQQAYQQANNLGLQMRMYGLNAMQNAQDRRRAGIYGTLGQMANLWNTYNTKKDNNELLGWNMRNVMSPSYAWTAQDMDEFIKKHQLPGSATPTYVPSGTPRKCGGKIRRKKKGLTI